MTKILIMDDEPPNLYRLQVLLSANGYTLDLASKGAEALARGAPPDLIISNILMPVRMAALCAAPGEKMRALSTSPSSSIQLPIPIPRMKRSPSAWALTGSSSSRPSRTRSWPPCGKPSRRTRPTARRRARRWGRNRLTTKNTAPRSFASWKPRCDSSRRRTALELDIAERTLAEARLRGWNRMYAVLSDNNQANVRIREPQALFDRICGVDVEIGGFRMVWISLLAESARAEAQLTEQLNELRRWHSATLGRETRVRKLKGEVNELLAHLPTTVLSYRRSRKPIGVRRNTTCR